MSAKQWPQILKGVYERNGNFGKSSPELMQKFQAMGEIATKAGSLDSKTKELLCLAIAIACRCEGCIAYHAFEAAKKGASREEIVETIDIAVYMGGGPSVVYGSEALEAFDMLCDQAKS